MMTLLDRQNSVTIMSVHLDTVGTGRTDRRTELVKQYRALHAVYADAR